MTRAILFLLLVICGCASPRPTGTICEHEGLSVMTIGRTHFDLYAITNVTEEIYYVPSPVGVADEQVYTETILKMSLAGAKMGWRWREWGAGWIDVSNNVFQTWQIMYRPKDFRANEANRIKAKERDDQER